MKYPYNCETCGETATIERFSAHSLGSYLTCDRCGRNLIFDVYDPLLVELRGRHLRPHDDKDLEDRLRPCTCGGVFSVDAPLRCPLCAATVTLEQVKAQIGPYFKDSEIMGVVVMVEQLPVRDFEIRR